MVLGAAKPAVPESPRAHATDEATTDEEMPALVSCSSSSDDSGDSDDDVRILIDSFRERVRVATAGQLPAEWMRVAGTDPRTASSTVRKPERADILSLFDGPSGNINRAASAFGLICMPAADLDGQFKVDL
jgi:hypothetical protein